jgi:hypothetical protein
MAKPRVQETATAGSGTLGSRMSSRPALEGRHSPVCFALPGLDLTRSHPGLRPLRVLRPGLCCTALSALVTISVSLTRMPDRGERPYMTMLSFANSGLFHYRFLPGIRCVTISKLSIEEGPGPQGPKIPALKARDSRAQGGRAREAGSGTLGCSVHRNRALKGRNSLLCRFQGLTRWLIHPRVSLHPGLGYVALSALEIAHLGLTPVPWQT